MKSFFVYFLVACILVSNTDMIRAGAYYFSGSMSFEQSLSFMQQHSIVERFYLLAGNALNYASIIFCWLAFKNIPEKSKFIGLNIGLFACLLYFFISSYELWYPIAQGAEMSENFALGFLKITLYCNIIGVMSVLLGFRIGSFYIERTKSL